MFSSCRKVETFTSLIPAEKLFEVNLGLDAAGTKLYVPVGAKETYASTSGWNEFSEIVEVDFTGTDEVKAENGTNGRRPEGLKAKVEGVYYDLSGRAVENPANGIYILDGHKVIVK